MMSKFRFVPMLGALFQLHCGSGESGGLSFGKTSPGTGGVAAASGGSGGTNWSTGGILSQGGASPGVGGIVNGGTSNGGTVSGGDTGAGGINLDSGVRVDGGTQVTFPSGGVISQQCAECATANCQSEARICEADQACWNMGLCVTTCFIPLQCAACFVGNQQARTEFSALQCCTAKFCSMCPSLGGLIACP